MIQWKNPKMENDIVNGTVDALIHDHKLKLQKNIKCYLNVMNQFEYYGNNTGLNWVYTM